MISHPFIYISTIVAGYIFIKLSFLLLEKTASEQPPNFSAYLPITKIARSPLTLIKSLLARCLVYISACVLQVGILDKNADSFSQCELLIAMLLPGIFYWINKNWEPFKIEFRKYRYLIFHLAALAIPMASSLGTWALHLNSEIVKTVSPKIENIVDTAWSSLLTALLAFSFFYLFQDGKAYQANLTSRQEIRFEEIINTEITLLKKRFYETFKELTSDPSNPKLAILFSILVIENLNRPELFRFFENILIKFPGIKLTLGIAQVYSDKPISNSESIEIRFDQVSDYFDSGMPIEEIFKNVNQSPEYIDEALRIYDYLKYKNVLPILFSED